MRIIGDRLDCPACTLEKVVQAASRVGPEAGAALQRLPRAAGRRRLGELALTASVHENVDLNHQDDLGPVKQQHSDRIHQLGKVFRLRDGRC